jgi:predicted RNase H-like HicB family nuclease
MERKYLVVVEHVESSKFSAYVPDLPGCAVCGETLEETVRLIQEAIAFHIEGLLEDGQSVPEPTSQGEYVVAETAA